MNISSVLGGCLVVMLSTESVQGGVYRPDVVRVGAEEAPLSQRARDVWVDGLIRQAHTLIKYPQPVSQE